MQDQNDQSDYNEDEAITAIINIINRSNETPDIYDGASYYEPDPNLSRIYNYKEYLRNFLVDSYGLPPSFIQWLSLHNLL